MTIWIKNNQKKQKLAPGKIRTKLTVLLRSLGIPDAELSVLFTGGRAMRTLNRTYRGIDKTTDVLSFPMREGAFPALHAGLLGDIVISVPTALRQAEQEERSPCEEIDRLLIHGLLHLLGYEHERSEKEARRMRRKERQLLKKLYP